MNLTETQYIFLIPAMEDYNHFIKTETLQVRHRSRIDQIRKENNEPVNYCQTCRGDNIAYFREMYRIWKEHENIFGK